jgi:hypothetical protein
MKGLWCIMAKMIKSDENVTEVVASGDAGNLTEVLGTEQVSGTPEAGANVNAASSTTSTTTTVVTMSLAGKIKALHKADPKRSQYSIAKELRTRPQYVSNTLRALAVREEKLAKQNAG